MTIEEVAEHLRVSERTVYDWAQKGEIPGGKLGATWRFRRSDIEKWVNARLSTTAQASRRGRKAATASFVLTPERVVVMERPNKLEVLGRLVDVLAETPFVKDREALYAGILQREALMSTGIGLGVGVPHVRIDSVTDLVMAVGVCRQPVPDYESLDESPVQIVCMLAARSDQHTQYIRALSAISARLRDPDVRGDIIAAQDPAEICKLITETEP